jgi:pimeloyl-ACP methyl ester carboxylesterase
MRVITDLDEMTAVIANGLFLEHHLYEEMASATRSVARVTGWRGERLDSQFGSEMAVAVYRPTGHKPPVVAFGNTRLPSRDASESIVRQLEQLAADIHEDLFPIGIGYYRYCYNEGRLKSVLEELVARFDSKVILTGHSLGGTLAQVTAMRMPEYVESVVTFQSPNTTRETVAALYENESPAVAEDLQSQSYHYKVVGDELIQEAGEISSPGEIVRLTYVDSEIDTPAFFYAHTKMVFEEMGRTRGSLRALRTIVEQKLVQIEVDTIGPPTGEVQSSLSTAIEWLRANGIMMAIAVPVLLSRGRVGLDHAGRLLQEVIYCALWMMNVQDFRNDPQNSVQFTDGIPGLPVQALVSDADLRRLRSEFSRYILHSRVRS